MRRLSAGTGRSFNCSLCSTLVQYMLAGCGLIPAIYLDSCGAHNNKEFNHVANKVGLTDYTELTGQRAQCLGESLSLPERIDCFWVERWQFLFAQFKKMAVSALDWVSKFPSDLDRADNGHSFFPTHDVLHNYAIPSTSLHCPHFSPIKKTRRGRPRW